MSSPTGRPAVRTLTHIGLCVSDFDASMAALTASVGIRWAPSEEREVTALFHGEEETRSVRWTVSLGPGPQFELIEGAPGSVWPADPVGAIHHLAYWTDDVDREVRELVDRGYRLEASARNTVGRTRFAYLIDPSGVRIEFADEESRPAWDSWTTGGDYGYEFERKASP